MLPFLWIFYGVVFLLLPESLLARDLQSSWELNGDQGALTTWARAILHETSNSKLQQWIESSESACGWEGVECGILNGEARITGINLSNSSLAGSMPLGLGQLTGLITLVAPLNKFNGSIPVDLGNCIHLEVLNLSVNAFSGSISGEVLGACSKLRYLSVSCNELEGPVPDELWSCENIEEIYLRKNNFSGNLTFVSRDRALLRVLDFYENSLSGELAEVVDAMGCRANLTHLDLSFNAFRGVVPASIANCSHLSYLNLQSNLLSGEIPDELGKLASLHSLGLGRNNFTGTIPETLLNCGNLSAIDVSRNALSGAIPRWLSQMPSLRYFTAHTNNLSGGIPIELASAPRLEHFDVGINNLSGPIRGELANMTTLRFLRLARNRFSGSVPEEFGNLLGLQGLDLSGNQLNGSLPASIGSLESLMWLQMAENQLTGAIPSEITKCRSLLWLNLRGNRLSGELPSGLFSTGSDGVSDEPLQDFPAMSFGECSLLLSWIPGEVKPFDSMAKNLKHEQCRTQWLELWTPKRPSRLGYWQLSHNSFTGPIPAPRGQPSNLSSLLLEHNDFTGSIPDGLATVPLQNIDLTNNSIGGFIPDIFESLAPTLISLHLAHNNLSGPFPASLNKLSYLSSYNFSYNPELEGPVPDQASFQNFVACAFLNDTKLCRNGDATQRRGLAPEMRACGNGTLVSSPPPSRSGVTEHLVLAYTLIGVFGGILAVVTVLVLALRCQTFPKQVSAVFVDVEFYDSSSPPCCHVPVTSLQAGVESLKALTYSDLVLATDNFSSAKIIGDGGFGMVYKAKLADGTVVAIKKLIQDGAQGDREFQAEMETLGLIKHANLLPLLGYCCRSRDRLLVYKCLTNGSLDDWLYESAERAARLTWPVRLRIAAGTARGLAFLHHQCEPLIIHRDMKTSNILLDENFDSCVTDFGLARLMDLQMSHVSTVVAGTPGYVPPEYGQTWRATQKGDVYSFGVVMLELASGKRPIGPEFHGMEGGNLVAWVHTLVRARRHREVFDPVVALTGDAPSIWQFLSLAVSCTSLDARHRPTMLHVTAILEELKSRQASITAFISDTNNKALQDINHDHQPETGVSLFLPYECGSDARLGGVQFWGPPRFSQLGTFFEFFFAKFGACGPELPLDAPFVFKWTLIKLKNRGQVLPHPPTPSRAWHPTHARRGYLDTSQKLALKRHPTVKASHYCQKQRCF